MRLNKRALGSVGFIVLSGVIGWGVVTVTAEVAGLWGLLALIAAVLALIYFIECEATP